MDRTKIQHRWAEIELSEMTPVLATARQLLHSAWSVPGTRIIYYDCAVDMMSAPELYTNIVSCTPAINEVSSIMKDRLDEIDILSGTAFFNEHFKYRSYKTSMKNSVEKLTKAERQSRLDELEDPMYLINRLRDNPVL